MKHLRYVKSFFAAVCVLATKLVVAQESTSSVGEQRAFEFVAPWPPWLTILILLASAIAVYGLYLREETHWPVWTKWFLATIRLSLIGLVLWMMYGFTERPFRTDLPDLLVFVDDSPSMQTVDAIQNERLKTQIDGDILTLELPDASRLSQAKSILLRNDAELLKFLQSNYQVKLLGLESDADQMAGKDDLESKVRAIQPTGEQSRLGLALRRGLQQRRGRPIASVLFLSDGITTDGPLLSEVAREAKQRQVPLHIVGLGSRLPARDIQLGDLLVNDVVFVGDLVTFDFKLSATGYANQSVEVSLRRADGVGEPIRKMVEISDQQASKTTRLVFKATEKGEFDFVIEVPRRKGEVSDENNRLTARVEVRDEKTRILLVQSYPNFEFHYLKTLLQRAAEDSSDDNGSVDLSVLLQDADPQFADIDQSALRNFPSREELFSYDVCIFGDVNPSYLSSQSLQDLRDFVVERGRGFIGVAGPRYFPAAYSGTPLAEIIPFEIRNALSPPPDLPIDSGFRPKLTALGQRMPAMQLSADPTDNANRWTELPELYWLLEVDALKMGTRTLAEHPTRTDTSDQAFPVVTLSYAGAGKVLFHCTDDSWRWRIGRGDEFFGRYWQQSIRYLSRFKLGEGRDVELTSDRETYERGETVRLRSRFFDDRIAPSEDTGVVVELEQAGSRRQQVVLNRDATQRGSFSGDVGSLRTGKYHAWISEPSFDAAAPAVDFEIVAPDTELTRLQIDTAEMAKAAELSNGEYYNYQNAQTLLNRLPIGKQVRIETLAAEPLWNSWPVALLFVALLVTEWLLRRQFGMV